MDTDLMKSDADLLRASFNIGANDRQQLIAITTKAKFLENNAHINSHSLLLDMYRAYEAGYRKQFN